MLGVGLWGHRQCGGHTKCLRDGICLELQDRDILSESEKVVEKGVPLQSAVVVKASVQGQ